MATGRIHTGIVQFEKLTSYRHSIQPFGSGEHIPFSPDLDRLDPFVHRPPE